MDSEFQQSRQQKKSIISESLKKMIISFIEDDEFEDSYVKINGLNVHPESLLPDINLPNKQKRKRQQYERGDPWNSSWGRMLKHPDVSFPTKRTGKLFRRRFRVPYQVFENLLELTISKNYFGHGKADCSGRKSIPVELKLLGVLRILGRGWCFDDVAEA